MADIDKPTQDVTIFNADGSIAVGVNVDNELLVHDQHAIELLEDIAGGTGVISANITSSWEFFASRGEAYSATYGATFTGGTTEQPFLLIKNPALSGHLLKIHRLDLSVATNSQVTFKLYRHATITANGTPVDTEQVGIHGLDTGVAEIFSIPTYSATGVTMVTYDLNSGGVGLITVAFDLAFILKEGEQVLITLAQNANNGKFTANVMWAEEEIIP